MNERDDNVPSLPQTIDATQIEPSISSNITDASNDDTNPPLPRFSPIGIGQPKTPPSRVLIMPSNEMMAEGYDSDGQCGPFIENGATDDEFYSMDEDVPEDPVVAVISPEDEGGESAPEVPEAELVLDAAAIEGMKVLDLRNELKKRGVRVTGNKPELKARLTAAIASGVAVLADRPAEQVSNRAGDAFDPEAYWKLLQPEENAVNESDMTVGGIRFREPTMPADEHEHNAEVRPKKRNYAETFDRLPFINSVLLPARKPNGKLKQKSDGEYEYEKQLSDSTHPNIEFLREKGIDLTSHPADWFDIFFPKDRVKGTDPKQVTVDELTSWTNTKAMICNAGKRGGRYSRFVDFSKPELMQHLALYLLHGISPSPQIEMKFTDHNDDPVNGSTLCNRLFQRNGVTRHKEFKAFFGAVNPLIPTPATTTHPNWKVDPVLKSIMKTSKEAVILGRDVSVDEQDVAFQGQHQDKQRISFKNAGDGFLVDTLCSEGYTFVWYFRNQVAPKKWTDTGLSPFHSRCMSLFQQLPNTNYVCGMDNLYMSAKFAKVAMNESGKCVYIHGVTRMGRGIPPCIMQKEVTKKENLLSTRGTVKAAQLIGDSTCKGLVAVSFYDSKPVYLISNACDKVQWTRKERKIWHKEKGKKVVAPFYRLNIVDQYNYGMGNVDQADQLRLQYRSTYWLRNRKWWWSLFFWLFEGALTNSYCLYRMFFKMHDRVPPLNHYEYIRAIALAWLEPERYWPRKTNPRKNATTTSSNSGSSISVISRLRPSGRVSKVAKNITFTDRTLDPYMGALRCRLDTHLSHLPEFSNNKVSNCQLCYWKSKSRVRGHVMKCSSCQIHLCLECYKPFHEQVNLQTVKEKE